MSHQDRIVVILRPLNHDFVVGYPGYIANRDPTFIEGLIEVRSLVPNYQFILQSVNVGSTVEQQFFVGNSKKFYHSAGKKAYTSTHPDKETVKCANVYQHNGNQTPLVGINIEFCSYLNEMLPTHRHLIPKTEGYVSTKNFLIVEIQFKLLGIEVDYGDPDTVFTKRSYFEIPVNFYNSMPQNFSPQDTPTASLTSDDILIDAVANKNVLLQDDSLTVDLSISPGLRLKKNFKHKESILRLLNIETKLKQIISFTGIGEDTIVTDISRTNKSVDILLEQSVSKIMTAVQLPETFMNYRITESDTDGPRTMIDTGSKGETLGIPFVNQNFQSFNFPNSDSLYSIRFEIWIKIKFGKDISHTEISKDLRIPITVCHMDHDYHAKICDEMSTYGHSYGPRKYNRPKCYLTKNQSSFGTVSVE